MEVAAEEAAAQLAKDRASVAAIKSSIDRKSELTREIMNRVLGLEAQAKAAVAAAEKEKATAKATAEAEADRRVEVGQCHPATFFVLCLILLCLGTGTSTEAGRGARQQDGRVC